MDTRLHSVRRFLAVALALCISLADSGREAAAVLRTWNNPAGGNASTPSNWTPSGVPGTGDFLTFNLNNTFTTNFSAATPASLAMAFRDGTVSLAFLSPHTVSSSIQLADTSQDTLTTKITSGTLTCTGLVSVAQFSPSRAALEVRGGTGVTTLLDLTSAANGNLVVGAQGTGTLDVLFGGRSGSLEMC